MMPPSRKITLVLTDNPLRGQPGQNDLIIAVSGEPDVEWTDGDPPPELLESPSFCAAIGMLTYLAGEVATLSLFRMSGGSSS